MKMHSNKLTVSLLLVLAGAAAFFFWPSDFYWQSFGVRHDLTDSQPSKSQAEQNEAFENGKMVAGSSHQQTESADSYQEINKKINSYYQNKADVNLDAVAPLLEHTDPQIASNALDLLAVMAKEGYQEDAIFKILADKASDPAYIMREQAMLKGAMLGRHEMLPLIAGYMNEQQGNSDRESVNITYELASRAFFTLNSPDAVPFVRQLLDRTEDPEIRKINYQTLARLNTPEAVDMLLQSAGAAKGRDQVISALALARTENEEAIGFLEQAVLDEQFSLETIAGLVASPQGSEIFGENLRKPDVAVETKVRLLDRVAKFGLRGNNVSRAKMADQMIEFIGTDEDSMLKVKALEVIGKLGVNKTVEIVPPLFEAEEPELRRKAVSLFAQYTNESNYAALESTLWDSDQKARRTAMSAMARYMGRKDIGLLKKLAGHSDKFMRQHAEATLQQLETME